MNNPIEDRRGSEVSRRKFLKNAAAGTAALTLGSQLIAQTTDAQATGMPMRPLGKTGVNVSILCLGGWHIGAVQDKNEAIRLGKQWNVSEQDIFGQQETLSDEELLLKYGTQ